MKPCTQSTCYWIKTEYQTIGQRGITDQNPSNGTIRAKPAGETKDANNLTSTTFDRNQSGTNMSEKAQKAELEQNAYARETEIQFIKKSN